MADTPEVRAKNRIKAAIKKRAEERGLRYKVIWNAGASYGEARVDADGVFAGHAIAIEAKRFDGKGKTTARQKLSLREYKAAGAATFLIEDEASFAEFDLWLQTVIPFVRWI